MTAGGHSAPVRWLRRLAPGDPIDTLIAVVLDLLPRRYDEHLRKLPKRDDAWTELAATVLRSAREISAADLAAVIGTRRKKAATALDRLADQGAARSRDTGDYVLWTATRSPRKP